ncbi:MAG: hypothetical protein IRY98_07305 [Alicyclobacillaceae bacterium]|nr:hypothetical protein [Alicyclobacillaceae bacterium]
MSTRSVLESLRPAVLLDADPAFSIQTRLREAVDRIVSMSRLPRLICPDDVWEALQARLTEIPAQKLTFIGSGDYHYLSALFVERIRRPVTILLLDHHDDASEEPRDLLSCGNWVCRASRHPWVKRILYTDGRIARWTNPAADNALLRWIPIALDRTVAEFPNLLLSWIPTPTVYISIDKDILQPSVAPTNWDQGILTLDGLLHILNTVSRHRTVAAMDVCGEISISLPGLPTPQELEASRKNEAVNLRLLAFWKQGSSSRFIPHSA